MRTLFLFLLLAVTISLSAQTRVTKDSQGNYTSVKSEHTKGVDILTNTVYKDSKGNVYPVYMTSTGKAVIHRTSAKTGKPYKQYLNEALNTPQQ